MLLDFNEIYYKYNLKINGVIQIGAHYGQETYHYINKNIQNLIFFEPLQKNFDVLQSRVPSHVITHKLALGNSNQKIKMFVESDNQGMSSSVLKPKLHTTQYPNIKFTEMEEVDMMRLDDVSFDRQRFNMINIDVQGYELEVFKGSVETLNHIDYIITEINRDELYEGGAQIEELSNFLMGFGFELVEFNWAGETWGDALYIKTNKIK